MDNKDNNIVDRLFAGRLKDASVSPPDGLWEGIAADLENDRLRKKVVYWRWVAAAVVLLFVTLGGAATMYFGLPGRAGAEIVSKEVISLPYTDPGAVSGRPQLALVNPEPEQPNTAVADEQADPDVRPNAAGFPADNVKAVQLSPRTQENVRRALAYARENSMQNLRKAPKALKTPVILAQLTPASVSLDQSHPAFGLRSQLGQALFAVPQPSPAPDHVALPLATKEKRVPRRLRKERPGLSLLADGSEPKERKRNQRKWAIGGSFSPDVAFASSTPVESSSLGRAAKVQLPDNPESATRKQSAPVATFTTGMRASVDLSERLALQSGIQYTRRSTSANHELNAFGQREAFENNFSLGYLEIPLAVKYKVIAGKKLDWFLSSGVSGNLFVDYQQELETVEGKVAARNVSDESDLFNPSQANFLVSTGLQYRIKDQVSLNLEPGFRYGFLTSKYSFTQYDPVSLSLATGVNFHF